MRTSIALLLIVLTIGQACAARMEARAGEPARGVQLRDDEWRVLVMPGPHPGPYRLKVVIDRSDPWPRAAKEPVEYRVTLVAPDGSTRHVGWLRRDLRALLVPVPLGDEAALLSTDREAAQAAAAARRERLDAAFDAITEATLEAPPTRELFDALGDGLAFLVPRGIEHAPAILWKHRILLEPHAAGEPLRQDLGPRAPEEPRYTWGEEVTDQNDPCAGRTPEVCVRERLEAIRDRLCNTLDENGAPRYFFECIVFSLKLTSEPPRVEIECNLEGAAAGVTPRGDILHLLTVNGEYFLTGDCLEGTILHELTHIFDTAAGRLQADLELRRAAERIDEARERLQELVDNPSAGQEYLDRIREAIEALQAAHAALEALRPTFPTVAVERLQTECRALFTVLDNWDFLGPRADSMPWVINSMQAMMEQQLLIPAGLNADGTPEVHQARCDCYSRMREWLRQNPDVERKMARQDCPYDEGGWVDFLDTLVALYCE